MTVKRLEKKEFYEADRISATCFHDKIEDEEAARLKSENSDREDWGAFTERGTMAAHIINNRLTVNLNGSFVPCGGIGAVSTLPEYRSSGAIREIFSELLNSAYESGEVISALYPFKHEFYRKFGYETASVGMDFHFKPNFLSERSFAGEARLYAEGDDVSPYLEIHDEFIKSYNLTVKRSAETMKRFLNSNALKNRKFTYLLTDVYSKAYISFDDVRSMPQARLCVTDLAWTGDEGLNAILGFLSRFEADYGTIELLTPTDVNLKLLAKAPYDTERAHPAANYMVRLINAKKALETLCYYAEEPCAIKIYGDEFISQNNGTFTLSAGGVTECAGESDMELPLTALNQLVCGVMSLKSAKLRGDIKINGKESSLNRIFTQKPAYLNDHF